MEFKKGRYVSFVVFIGGSHPRDWMACAWRDAGSECWEGEYRFRYHGTVHDPWAAKNNDTKRFYSFKAPHADERDMRSSLGGMAEMLVLSGFNEDLDWLDIRSDDPERALTLLASRPWAHIRAGA
jgi:hypothetical protein